MGDAGLVQRSPLKPNGRDSRYKDPPLPVRSTHSKSDSNSISQDSSELPEELRLSSILSSYSARNLTLRLENDYKVNSCPNSLFCQIAHAPLTMILSYLKTKTLLKNCHIILYWTQESSFPSQVWSPGRGAPQFILSANVRYPIHSLEYTPGLWQVIAFLLRGLDTIDPGVEVGLGPIPLLSSHLPLRWRKVTHKGC